MIKPGTLLLILVKPNIKIQSFSWANLIICLVKSACVNWCHLPFVVVSSAKQRQAFWREQSFDGSIYPEKMPPTRKDASSKARRKTKDGESSGEEEYRKKRDRNNMAVKRSRVKSRMKTQETLERVDQLKRENDQLVEKINLMSKELSFLKDLFIAQASTTGIPNNVDLDQLFADNEPITDTKPNFFDNME